MVRQEEVMYLICAERGKTHGEGEGGGHTESLERGSGDVRPVQHSKKEVSKIREEKQRTFELLASIRLVLVLVRVMLQCHFTVALFDLVLRGRRADPQGIVELRFCDHCRGEGVLVFVLRREETVSVVDGAVEVGVLGLYCGIVLGCTTRIGM